MSDLLPCPFCGSEIVSQWSDESCVVCHTCGAEGPMSVDHSLSHLGPTEAWNRRDGVADLLAAGEEWLEARAASAQFKGDVAAYSLMFDRLRNATTALATAFAAALKGGTNG